MITYFLKRLIKHQASSVKWLILFLLGAFLTYKTWTDTETVLTNLDASYYQSYIHNRKSLDFYERTDGQEELSTYEQLVLEQNLTHHKAGVLFYETFQKEDYDQSVHHYLKKLKVTYEAYKIGNGQIPPGGKYFVSTVKQYGHFVTLNEVYYRDLLTQPDQIGREEVINVSALDLFLHLTGYWKAKESDWFNLNTYLFLIPLLFSIGIITRDRKIRSLYSSVGYSSKSYVRDLFFAKWIYTTFCQILTSLLIFLPLAYRFGLGNSLIKLAFIWDGYLMELPFLSALGLYALIVVVLDALLILLSIAIELALEELSAITMTSLVFLAGIRLSFLGESYFGGSLNPFYYLDVFRSMNGWVNMTSQGLDLSLDHFLIGSASCLGGLLVLIYVTLSVKERRGYYV